MNITLKNLKISASLSEETTAYTATIYVDGKPAFHASNHGHGGCDMYHQVQGYDGPSEQEISAWLKANREPHKAYGMEIEYDLEMEVSDLITKQEREKRLDRMLKTKIVVLGQNKGQPAIFTYPAKYKPTPENLARVPLKAGETLLNNRPELRETALALV